MKVEEYKKLISSRAAGRHIPGEMNKTEAAYANEILEIRKRAGEIIEYWFETVTLKLANGVRYTPDFFVRLKSNEYEFHEVKGFWRDDARVKIKVAAGLFPFQFFAVQRQKKRDGGGWTVESF
jgi:hypothetical protein